jgi:D-arginine dehydrogenase
VDSVTTTHADVLIIGGGIAGLSLAAALPESLSISLIEQESTFAFHSSGRSARQMQPSYGPPAIRALTEASIPLIAEISARSSHPILRPRPLVWFAQVGNERAVLNLVRDVPRLESLDEAGIQSLNPALRLDRVAAAAVDSHSFEVRVGSLVEYYEEVARLKGVRLIQGAAGLSARRTSSLWSVRTSDSTIDASIVVNAAGAWSDSVARIFGATPLGLTPHRRTVAIARPRGMFVDPEWAMVSDVAGTLYFRPDGEDVLMSPSEEVEAPPGDAQPNAVDLNELRGRINHMTDLDIRDISRSWTGLRTFVADHLPVVGPDTHVDGFYWLAGQGGYGIQTAAAIARLVSAQLTEDTSGLGHTAEHAFSSLDPQRFRAQVSTPQQA